MLVKHLKTKPSTVNILNILKILKLQMLMLMPSLGSGQIDLLCVCVCVCVCVEYNQYNLVGIYENAEVEN